MSRIQALPDFSMPCLWKSDKMDCKVASQWHKELNSKIESSVLMDFPRDGCTEEQIHQATAAKAMDQQIIVLNIWTDPDTSHTYVLLKWSKDLPACFGGLQLTANTEVQQIQMIISATLSGGSSQKTPKRGSTIILFWSKVHLRNVNTLTLLPTPVLTGDKTLANDLGLEDVD